MQSYKTIKDIKVRDSWLKRNGYNPHTFFNPDFDTNLLRAKAATKNLLNNYFDILTQEQINLLQKFKKKATKRRTYQILNLYKKIRRQLHSQHQG